MKICVNGILRDATSEEVAAMEAAAAEQAAAEKKRPLSASECMEMLLRQQIQTLTVDDTTAYRMKAFYPAWEDVIGQEVKKGFKFRKGENLYETAQALTFQEQYPPDAEGMLALYRSVEPEHTGTLADPIPWVSGMDCVEGKYYSYGGKTYRVADGGTMKPCVWPPDTPDIWQWEVVE